jgi:hypothetical protein
MATNVITGARAQFYINGTQVAWASGVSVGETIQYEEVDVLDEMNVAEHVPVGVRITLSCEIFRTVNGTQGAQPRGKMGSLKGQGIFPKNEGTPNNILTTTPYSVIIKDRLTGATLAAIDGVKASSQNFNISPRGLVGQNVQFVAIRLTDDGK